MVPQARQGLVLGAIVGVALAAFMYMYNHSLVSLVMIPIGALMGMAPWLLKPKDE